jgi:riboflavin kinase/FMN adenylyltransferase
MTSARLIRLDGATRLPPSDSAACTLVIGNFDGVHRGHQAVLAQAVARSRAAGGLIVCALTFDPHPAQVVGSGALPLLTSLEDRVELLGDAGVERVYVRRFDSEFASWRPERFASELVAESLRAKLVVVGDNFRFGVNRTGDLALLRALGEKCGFGVFVPEVASDERGPYSSTRARDAVVAGDLDEARRVLGRPHAVDGVVVHGDARGRTIGFPTANLEGIPQVLPPNGVYAVTVDRGRTLQEEDADARYVPFALGLVNVGVRPTIAEGKRDDTPPSPAGRGRNVAVEAHLLDVATDLYGRRLRLHFVARLRDEQKFASIGDLKAQIARDVTRGRAVLEPEGWTAAGRRER